MPKPQLTEFGEANLSAEEAAVVGKLTWLAKQWPRRLMLAAMGPGLHVMLTADHMDESGTTCDPNKIVADIDGIPVTGGDW